VTERVARYKPDQTKHGVEGSTVRRCRPHNSAQDRRIAIIGSQSPTV